MLSCQRVAQYGSTPLILAAQHAKTACARLLLDRGADKDAKAAVCALLRCALLVERS